MIKPLVKILLLFFLSLVLVFAAASFYFHSWLSSPVALQEDYIYSVKKGATLYSVSRDLKNKNIIKFPYVWVYYAKLKNLTKIKAGEYSLEGSITPLSLLHLFNSDDVIRYSSTNVME